VLPAMRDMAAAAGDADSFAVYAMSAPPLVHDGDGTGKLIAAARLGIPMVYGSATAAGATAPCSRAATLLVANAEVLSGLVIHQLAAPGAPFVCTVTQGSMNLGTAAEVYCGPEAFAQQQAHCDLYAWYGLPSFAWGGCSDAKLLDAQWSAETALTLVLGALTRGTLVHDLGFFCSGLQSSHESIALADELAGYAKAFLAGVDSDDEAFALDEIRAVGPGGDFLAQKRTRVAYRCFWHPRLIDQWNYAQWETQGAQDLLQRLRARVAQMLAEPRTFTLPAQAAALIDGPLLAAAAAARAG
jgi:trimethylamine---corrinoid protein Co-methyltransferase